MASMRRTIVRMICRKSKQKVRKAPKNVVSGTMYKAPVKILKASNPVPKEQIKPTAAVKFKNMIQNIVKKVKSWVA